MSKEPIKAVLWQKFVGKNDYKAFEEMFYSLNSRLIKFCVLYVHQREIAEEIVSDVFVNCWINRATLQDILNPETYLFVCVKHKAINYTKKMSTIHLVNLDGHSSELIDLSRPDTKFEKKELLLKLDEAIETLPLQCRVIFRLVKEDGMKYREVAEVLGISVRTVETQVFRAMKKLSMLMQQSSDQHIVKKALRGKLTPLITFCLSLLY